MQIVLDNQNVIELSENIGKSRLQADLVEIKLRQFYKLPMPDHLVKQEEGVNPMTEYNNLDALGNLVDENGNPVDAGVDTEVAVFQAEEDVNSDVA